MVILFICFAIAAGCGSGMQSAINGGLGKKVGIWEANTINMFVGSIALGICTLILGTGNLAGIMQAPAVIWIGNAICPAIAIGGIIYCAPKLGTGTTAVTQSIGQFTTALIIDTFGLFGASQIAINPLRVLGIIFMIIGLYFVHILYRKNAAKKADQA